MTNWQTEDIRRCKLRVWDTGDLGEEKHGEAGQKWTNSRKNMPKEDSLKLMCFQIKSLPGGLNSYIYICVCVPLITTTNHQSPWVIINHPSPWKKSPLITNINHYSPLLITINHGIPMDFPRISPWHSTELRRHRRRGGCQRPPRPAPPGGIPRPPRRSLGKMVDLDIDI